MVLRLREGVDFSSFQVCWFSSYSGISAWLARKIIGNLSSVGTVFQIATGSYTSD
jgi:hypothetical protein